jgi:phosphoglycerate dehydrogenase-like enzyme
MGAPVIATRPGVAVAIGPEFAESVLAAGARDTIARRAELTVVDLAAPQQDRWPDVGILFTGWGTPRLDAAVLDRFPELRVVLHAAGTVRHLVTPELWRRGIRVSTATSANAIPVAEFTVAQILLALKNAWRLALQARTTGSMPGRGVVPGVPGATVGLVGLGHIGRLVARRLAKHEVRVLAHDPYADEDDARRLGLELAPLEDVAARSEVLSLHAPLTDDTTGMIGESVLDRLPAGATLVNTARGGLIDHTALTAFLLRRPDVFALLDVTEPEPLADGHPLLTMANTLVTPHIAGSLGREEARLGNLLVAELFRWLDTGTLAHEIHEDRLASLA